MSTILVVDDIPANRKFLVTLLCHEGHRVLEAGEGRAALAVVHAERPDLVIADVLMPLMDGYEFVKQLRLDPIIRGTPVVFWTAHYGAREARALALASGVLDVLIKPAASADVLRVVTRALAGHTTTGQFSTTHVLANSFDQEHLRLITDQLSEKADDLRLVNVRLRALINIGLELASERDADSLLQSVCEAACELFSATYVTVGIVDTETGAVRRFVTCGTDVKDWVGPGHEVPGILHTVVRERRILRGDNPTGDPAHLQLPPAHPEVRAFLAVPIASPTRVYGWMCLVGNDATRTFTALDEPLVGALSGQAGRIYESICLSALTETRKNELEREVLERKHAEAAVRAAEERMRFALESARIGIWDMDFSTGVLQCSALLEAQYGLEPGTFGGTFDAMMARVHPLDREALLASMNAADRSGEDFSVQYRTLWPDGTVHWLSGAGRIRLGTDGRPERGVGISMDVTDRHVLEAQFQQAQKMDAIGRLAGGVAHDFNNLLTVIIGHCGLLADDLSPDSAQQVDVAQIRQAGESAAALTRQLLAFSRKEIIEPTVLDVNAVVAEMRSMVERLLGEDIAIVIGLAPGQALVKADKGQVGQIILNLAVNARDAMPRGGTLTIQTAYVELDEHYVATHFSVRPGPYVALTVTDTGIGMSADVQARLFEPFFTTKDAGRGTGLGLATVHGIVARSGGSVHVYSEVGEGASFKVYFPRIETAEMTVPAPSPVPEVVVAGAHTVLVVEDAAPLRELTRRLLERQGYRVLVAASADEARQIFDDDTSIRVLLTDVVMPGTSGPELTQDLIGKRPGLKVIYMSGHTEDAIVHRGVLKPGITFLQKPFTAEKLGRTLQTVIRT